MSANASLLKLELLVQFGVHSLCRLSRSTTMAQLFESPLIASLLESDFPDELWLITLDRNANKHLCLRAENVPGYDVVHGVACAKSQEDAQKIAAYYHFPGDTVCLSFEEARELAKTKPDPIAGLLLEDGEGNCIAFHFVK